MARCISLWFKKLSVSTLLLGFCLTVIVKDSIHRFRDDGYGLTRIKRLDRLYFRQSFSDLNDAIWIWLLNIIYLRLFHLDLN